MNTVLLIDDNLEFHCRIRDILEREGYFVSVASTWKNAAGLVKKNGFELVLLDMKLEKDEPRPDPFEVITAVFSFSPGTDIIIISGFAEVGDAVRAVKMGVYDFLEKTESDEKIINTVKNLFSARAGRKELEAVKDSYLDGLFAGQDGSIISLKEEIKLVAGKSCSVLLEGETGTGKELAARALHALSGRQAGGFIAVNCTAMPGQIFESELFGYKKGAFTGADRDREGLIEAAAGGTLFLDEVGDMDLAVQGKLLRFLDSGSYMPLGARKEEKADARVVSATNRDLQDLMKKGRFREDLYFRLSGFSIKLKPLRERRGDIEQLLYRFLGEAGSMARLDPAALKAVKEGSWSGNVRELKNFAGRLALYAGSGEITTGLVEKLLSQTIPSDDIIPECSLPGLLEAYEKKVIAHYYARTGGDAKLMARVLKVDDSTVYRLLKKFGIK